MDPTESRKGEVMHPTSSTNWAIDVADIRTVKVSNIASAVPERDILEFFSFSGEIQYIEMQRESETTKAAFVTFGDSQGADTAALLTGATIGGLSVSVTPIQNYQLPPNAILFNSVPQQTPTDSALKKAEDVASTMLAKGYVLGKGALIKAKSFDEKHHLRSNASATVASLDRRMGLSQKISVGTAVVNEKVKEMDERFQVSEKTKSAYTVAEQKASDARSALMSNRYASASALWVTTALAAVSKAAEEVSAKTKEKVEKAEEENKEMHDNEKNVEPYRAMSDNESPTIAVISQDQATKLV